MIYNNYPKGSEWIKWDLHFHTPSSYDYKDNSVMDEDIINILIKNEIRAIAITDHHKIDIQRIKNLQEIGKDKITVLPAIEFRSELGGSENIHFIAIFSEKSDLEEIWTKLSGNLKITPADIARQTDEKIYCDFIETSILVRELGGIITVHAGNKSNSIENSTNALPYKQAIKTDLIEYIDIYEVGKEEDVLEYKTKVFPNINKIIPMILCSDNHNIRGYKLKQNLWIKANPTFEGLRQIIYEPERSNIQSEKPDEKRLSDVIDKVRFIDSSKDMRFSNDWIELNPNLNTIIGGKSTGKTLLLHYIAQSIGYENAKYDFTALEFEVSWGDGVVYRLSNQTNKDRPITYIAQQELADIVDKQPEKFTDLVLEYLKEKPNFKIIFNDFEINKNNLQNSITGLITEYLQLFKQLEDEQNKKLGDKIAKQNEIKINTNKIEEIQAKSSLSLEEKEKFNQLEKKIEDLEKELNQKNELLSNLNEFKKFVN